MATSSVLLAIGAATLPDGSAGNIPPAIQLFKSSAAAPSPHDLRALFDAATDEWLCWGFRMPDDYASGPILKVQYAMTSATTGAVRLEGRISATTPGEASNINAVAFAATNSVGDTVAGTAGHMKEASITLTNADSLAAGDRVIVYLRRDADGTTGTDDAAGDMQALSPALVYTTT